MIELKPLEDRIVVKVLEPKEETKGGIVLPESAQEKPQEGEVLAVGPGRLLESGERVSPEVKVGDRIFFAKYGGTEVRIGEEEYIIMREGDVLAVIEE
ncbi:MAG TPA: co-chaperone GroES [Armatimonadetes bacterium]|nr:co-chaperone GroES [Armatimonadota bacterium]